MGCNYYLQAQDPCPCCKRPYAQLHIGKQSSGWEFLFATYPEANIVSVADWKREMEGKTIIDEYGVEVSHEVFWEIVELSHSGKSLASNPQFHGDAHYYEYRDTEGYRMSSYHDFS